MVEVSKVIDEAMKVRGKYINGDGIIGNCHEMCIDLNERLKSIGLKSSIVVGEIGNNPFWTTKHYWLLVRGKKLGVDGLVIIDPSIDQFSSENAMNGMVDIDLGIGIPEVGIFTKKDREWNYYNP